MSGDVESARCKLIADSRLYSCPRLVVSTVSLPKLAHYDVILTGSHIYIYTYTYSAKS